MNRTDDIQQPQLDFEKGAENKKSSGSQKRALIVIGILLLLLVVVVFATIALFSVDQKESAEPTMKDGQRQKQHLRKKRQDDERKLAEMEDKLVENPGADRTTSARSIFKEFETLYDQEKGKDQGGSSFKENVERYDPFDNDLGNHKDTENRKNSENTLPGLDTENHSSDNALRKEKEKKSMQVIKDEDMRDKKESTEKSTATAPNLLPGGILSMTKKRQSITIKYNETYPLVTLYEGNFLEGVLLTEICSDIQEGPVIAATQRDFYDDSGVYVIIPYGTRVIGKTGAVNYRGQKRLYISFSRMILPQRKPGEKRVSIDLPLQAAALDSRGINGLASRVDRHFWLQYGSALLLGVLDGVTGLARNRIKGSDFSVMIDEPSHNLSSINDSRFSSYSSIMPTVTVKAGAKVKIYMSCDIEISAFDLTRNRPYVKSKQRRTP